MAEHPEVARMPAPRSLQAEGRVGDARYCDSQQGINLVNVDALAGTGHLMQVNPGLPRYREVIR